MPRWWGLLAPVLLFLLVACDDGPPVTLAPSDDGVSGEPIVEGIGPGASASSSGIRLTVTDATFTPAETRLTMAWVILDEASVIAALDERTRRGGEILAVSPARNALAGPFEEPAGGARGRPDGMVVVELPPLSPEDDYDGTVALHIGAVEARTAAGFTRIEGDWTLVIAGPSPHQLDGVDRTAVERFAPATFEIAGHEVVVSGHRSVKETRIAVELPPELALGTHPVLLYGRDRLEWQGGNFPSGTDPLRNLSFRPTPFGATVELELPLVELVREVTTTLTVDVRRALDRAETGTAGFTVEPADVLRGDAGMVVGVDRGSDPRGPWLAITVRGLFHPDTAAPRVLDEHGEPLERRGVQLTYGRDADRNIGTAPETTISAMLPDRGLPSRVTLELGPERVVVEQAITVRLEPEP